MMNYPYHHVQQNLANVGVSLSPYEKVIYSSFLINFLEPTPVSNVIHCKHLHEQQQKLLLLKKQQKRCAELECITLERGIKRKRGEKIKAGFSPYVMVHHNPRERDEILTTWYSKKELTSMKLERKKIFRALKRVNFDLSQIDQSVHQLRGLEPFFSMEFNKLIQKKRSSVFQSVMAEQALQRREGKRDVEALRNASLKETKWARLRGIELGRKDAVDAIGGTKDNNSQPGLHQQSTSEGL